MTDHIYHSRTVLFIRHAWEPHTYATDAEGLADLQPSLAVPSDHMPVIVDLSLPLLSARAKALQDACDTYARASDVGLVRQLLNEGGGKIINTVQEEVRRVTQASRAAPQDHPCLL